MVPVSVALEEGTNPVQVFPTSRSFPFLSSLHSTSGTGPSDSKNVVAQRMTQTDKIQRLSLKFLGGG
jgi:hypothetical protein